MNIHMKIGLISPFMAQDLADLLDDKSLQLLQSIKGVAAPTSTQIAREWHQQGHSIIVFCLDPSIATPQILTGERLKIYVLPKRRSRYCLIDVYKQERRYIFDAVSLESPDVLSAQWTYDHSLGALDCKVPTLVTCHDTPLRCAWISRSIYMIYHVFIAAYVIRHAQQLVCVSPYTAKHIKKVFRPTCPVHIIPNGLSKEIFDRGTRQLNKTSPSLNKTYSICSIGGWGDLKNTKKLIKAYAEVRKNKPDTRLVLFGSGLDQDGLGHLWAKSQRMDQGVDFRGHTKREEILDFLEYEANLMVHPSKVETHGMALIEAMACGVAVIGGIKSGAVPWTLEEGKAGILCDINKPNSIANAIRKAIDHPGETRNRVEYAWKSVSRRFQIELTAESNEKLLAQLVNHYPAK